MNNTPRTEKVHRDLVKLSEGPNWIAGKDYETMKDHARQLETELNAANAKIAELRDACNVALGWMTGGADGDWRDCDYVNLLRQALSTTAPSEPMVPWSVVKRAMDAEFAVNVACDDELDEALKSRKEAREQLQSYAPRQENTTDCDLCHDNFTTDKLTLQGTQMLCPKCRQEKGE